LRQRATPLSIEIEISIWEIAMTTPEQKNELRSIWIKTAEQQLFYELPIDLSVVQFSFDSVKCLSEI